MMQKARKPISYKMLHLFRSWIFVGLLQLPKPLYLMDNKASNFCNLNRSSCVTYLSDQTSYFILPQHRWKLGLQIHEKQHSI